MDEFEFFDDEKKRKAFLAAKEDLGIDQAVQEQKESLPLGMRSTVSEDSVDRRSFWENFLQRGVDTAETVVGAGLLGKAPLKAWRDLQRRRMGAEFL